MFDRDAFHRIECEAVALGGERELKHRVTVACLEDEQEIVPTEQCVRLGDLDVGLNPFFDFELNVAPDRSEFL